MAWRIHESVIRGEIDNRQRGTVRGTLWLEGQAEPITLDLKGNAAPDLAGCLLTFENPQRPTPLPPDGHLALVQRGSVGDLTASRKVRVFDLPFEEAYERLKRKEPVPEHLANCLYLEWYSDANGRVVVESVDYRLTISPPAWRLTSGEEEERQQDTAAGFNGFLDKLNRTLSEKEPQPQPDEDWDEFDYERFMRECDARTGKYAELLDKYRDDPDRDRIIAREMGWASLEPGSDSFEAAAGASGERPEPDADPLATEDDGQPLEPDPATAGVDWVRDQNNSITHPLALRAREGCLGLWRQYDELGLDRTEDEDLVTLQSEYQITSAKLAGALDGLAYGRDLSEGAFIVAYLKRALSHLHLAQAALENVAAKAALPQGVVDATRGELFALREEILRLMNEFRRRP